MGGPDPLFLALVFAPVVLMSGLALWSGWARPQGVTLWRGYALFAGAALLGGLAALAWLPLQSGGPAWLPWLAVSLPGAWMALLVQLLATVIGVFSSRYLNGEAGQSRYVTAFASVVAAVHLLLLADHWLVLIGAWALVGVGLQRLLCFYADRPFALLAAHKKRLADRLADVLLLGAAVLAWTEVGSGSLSDLRLHLDQSGASVLLQGSAVCLVLAVIVRTALLPVHGWLIQVMEAPTPVSALLHAGVVNLGGWVLIRFAPLLEAAVVARWLLIGFGLATALLAGAVMLTRVSIKVRLAWSTVAQMGFMVLECGLGLYTLAALHLVGHSLYKAHAFLSAASVVQQSRLQMMRGTTAVSPLSLIAAPVLAAGITALVVALADSPAWPWWWSGVLALAWSPMLWLPRKGAGPLAGRWWRAIAGGAIVAVLTSLALLVHAVPLGLEDSPHGVGGIVALTGMAAMYACLVTLQINPHRLAAWRRWTYAGFYLDEFYTRLALQIWPSRWGRAATRWHEHGSGPAVLVAPSEQALLERP